MKVRADRKAAMILATYLSLVCVACGAASAKKPLVDRPVAWYDDDSADIGKPAERDPNLLKDQIRTTFVLPVRRLTKLSNNLRDLAGDRWPEARDVNALDEALNSSWFTNRIGLFPMTPEEAVRGAGDGDGPDRSGPWTVVSAKTEGVTPGFNIRDPRGDVYVIKFDPPGSLGLTSGAGAIVSRIFHAAGYNVPEDAVILFRRERIVLGEGVKIKVDGRRRPMIEADLDAILDKVERTESGGYLAISSKFLSGEPIGPFDYKGRRGDDPNDRVRHENRRELRGLRLLSAWVNHFDTKQENTLDMYVEEEGRRFVRHHLIDFASTLGVGATGAHEKNGWEYGFDGPRTLTRILALGFREDDWRRIGRPEGLEEVGYLDTKYFSAASFEPLTPNTAFARMTDRDGYWAAKIISAFRDDHLAAICATAKYRNPEAAPYVARALAERRDIIAREYFTKVCPIDYFRVEKDSASGIFYLLATDLGVERGLWPRSSTRYRVRATAVDENRSKSTRGSWREVDGPGLPLPGPVDGFPFQAVECQVDRGGGWSPPVTVYVSTAKGRVVAVER